MADGEQDDDASKTEDPTPKKLEEARKRGQVALSRELSTWLLLLASTLVVGAMMGTMFMDLTTIMQKFLSAADQMPVGPGGIGVVLTQTFLGVMGVITLPLLLLMAAAFFGPFAQIGPLFTTETITPDLQKISIMKGLSRLFSRKSLLEFFKGLVKIGVVSIATYFVLAPYLPGAEHMVGLGFPLLLDELHNMTMRLLTAVAMIMMVFAIADVTYQRYDLYTRLRMTPQELKDEYRQTEGDPMIRGRLRQLRQEKARKRMMQNVPKADVIITNPTHYAVALQYDPDTMPAPKVVAKGADFIAKRIREIARENNIELVENKPLARALFDTVEIDQIIPADLYRAVAEVITYVFKKSGKLVR